MTAASKSACLMLVAALTLLLRAAAAATLTVGYHNEPTSFDPQTEATTANLEINLATYEALTGLGSDGKLQPVLATSWKLDSDNVTWTMAIRPNVTFQDGSKLVAADVKASLDRAVAIKSAAPFGAYVRAIAKVDVVDEATVRIVTKAPDPRFPENLAFIAIMKAAAAEHPGADFNSLAVKRVGTGPYFIDSSIVADRIVLRRFDGYWRGMPEWDQVIIRLIKNDASRIAALLAGEVDLITSVPPSDVGVIKGNPNLAVLIEAGNRTPYIAMDQHREQSPDITDNKGAPIRNPFLDWRVRKAMDLALNRSVIVDRVFDGLAAKSVQIEPPGQVAHSDALDASPMYSEVDVAKARKLLAAAGVPDGFRAKLYTPDTTFQNSSRYVQALAQMWTRIGVTVEPDVVPLAVFLQRWRAGDYSMGVFSYGGSNLEPDRSILAVLHSKQEGSDGGLQNGGRFVNPKIDTYYDLGAVEMNPEIRAAYLRAAQEAVVTDVNLIITHRQQLLFGLRKTLTYHQVPADEYFRITEVHAAK